MGSKRHATPRGSLTTKALVVYLAIGFVIGTAGGYIFMGTTHAILETRGGQHYSGSEGGEAQQAAAAAGGGAASAGAGTAARRSAAQKPASKGKAMHTLCTSNGSPYQNYQTRIAYATYQLTAAMPGGEHQVAFTRILHRQTPDILMEEVPTFRANPLQVGRRERLLPTAGRRPPPSQQTASPPPCSQR